MIYYTRDSLELMKKIMDMQDESDNIKNDQDLKIKLRSNSKEYKISPRTHNLNAPLRIRGLSNSNSNNNVLDHEIAITPSGFNIQGHNQSSGNNQQNNVKLFSGCNSSSNNNPSCKIKSARNSADNTMMDNNNVGGDNSNGNGNGQGNDGGDEYDNFLNENDMNNVLQPIQLENGIKKPPIMPNIKNINQPEQIMVNSINMDKSSFIAINPAIVTSGNQAIAIVNATAMTMNNIINPNTNIGNITTANPTPITSASTNVATTGSNNLKASKKLGMKNNNENNENEKPQLNTKPSYINNNSLSIVCSNNNNTNNNNKEYHHKSPRQIGINISPRISPYSKVNANKNLLQQYGDSNNNSNSNTTNEVTNKNLFSQFLTKVDVLNFINPKLIDKRDFHENLKDKDRKDFHETLKDKPINDNLNMNMNSPRLNFNECIQPFNTQINTEINVNITNDVKKKFQSSQEIRPIEDNRKQNMLVDRKKAKCRHESLTQNSIQRIIETGEKIHRLSSGGASARNLFSQSSNNINNNTNGLGGINTAQSSMIKLNVRFDKIPDEAIDNIKNSGMDFLPRPSNLPQQIMNGRKDLGIISSGILQLDDKLKSTSDKSQLMNVILDLKSKLHEKELEIIDMKNNKLKYDMENQTLINQMKDLMLENKTLEESIEKFKQMAQYQEREIDYLKKSKQRLEGNLNEAFETNENIKIKRYETKIDEKNREIRDLSNKLNLLATEQKILLESERTRMQIEIKKYENLLEEKDMQIKNYEQELANISVLKKEYSCIDKKIYELEEMQNKLIEENNSLRAKINIIQHAKVLKEKETENMESNITKELNGQLLQIAKKLKDVEDLVKALIQVVQSSIKGDEPPIELIIKHHKRVKDKKSLDNTKETQITIQSLKQLCLQNYSTIELMQKSLSECMGDICDLYALKYGSECNLQ